MHRSASGTCSFADVVLSWGKSTRRGSNSQSPRIEETINPIFSYIVVTFFRIFDKVFFFLSILQNFDSDELHVPRACDDERYLVDKHDVDA
mmetsp:Transcript_1241/g.1655  ORF Transcript_1241/g.1655 Transcript_1241/m.1655 type:complete len:91 (+) Transcript_1241:2263-2535(+)